MHSSTSVLRILNVSLRKAELRTRMPFRYGIAVMRDLPHVFVQLDAEIGGVAARGIAADHLPPKWFTKDPDRALADEIADMARVISHAAQIAQKIEAPTPFAFGGQLYDQQGAWGAAEGYPPLLAHFGTSLMERALIDACCRRWGKPFHELLRGDAFGIDLGEIHPELRGTAPRDWLPAQPAASVHCRHTIGLSDPLEDADIAPEDVLRDGLPQSLTACIRHYGLSQFKIKFTADRAQALSRLRSIAAVLVRETGGNFAASLDGNESFYDVGEFRAFWNEARALPELAPLFQRLLFVEQPLHRSVALGEEVQSVLPGWKDRPPIIIDESDAETGSLRRALECGYAGTSHKNCKGVFRGVANACRLVQLRRAGGAYLMSAEDLTTIGPVSLLQDLAVQAALGNESVERNGHHYFRGLSFWPESIQRQMLEQHGDLYGRTPEGVTALRVEKGRINLGTVNAAPFGVGPLPDLSTFAPL
jgi:hypothetical protein